MPVAVTNLDSSNECTTSCLVAADRSARRPDTSANQVGGPLYVNFTDETRLESAVSVVPCIGSKRPEKHARLTTIEKVRLSWMPVGVGHERDRLDTWIG